MPGSPPAPKLAGMNAVSAAAGLYSFKSWYAGQIDSLLVVGALAVIL
jgi:hypothetical protein